MPRITFTAHLAQIGPSDAVAVYDFALWSIRTLRPMG
jgi:hypothetical protein